MAVQLVFMKRRPDLTHEQFVDTWTGPYAAKFPNSPWAKPNPDVLRYRQHALEPAKGWDYDGMAEVWLTSREAGDRVGSSEYYQRSDSEVVSTFLDMDARIAVWDDPHVVVENLGSGSENIVVMLSFYKRRADWTHEQYVDYWTGPYTDAWRQGPWAKPNPDVIRYVQHALEPTEGWNYDGFSEVWFSSPEAVRSVLSSEAFKSSVPDLPQMLDPAGCVSVWDRQQVVAENVGGGPAVTSGLPVQYVLGGGGAAN